MESSSFIISASPTSTPEEVDSVYDVVFESPLNKMKDSDVLTGLVQVIHPLLPMAADNPGLFDKINMDKAVEMALESVGVPSVILHIQNQPLQV
jgi:hypothetical protein